MKPRPTEIIPRSMDVRPKIEDEEWRRIGYKRNKYLDVSAKDEENIKTTVPKIVIVAPIDHK